MVKIITKFFGSFGLACVLLISLNILTFFATLEQVDHGIYDVQKKYFNSLFVIHFLFGTIPVPFPGGALLLGLLFLNILCGSFIRIKKKLQKLGILVAHAGIVLLLVSGFITFAFSYDGHMTLYETQKSDEFQSYFEWELVITHPLEENRFKEWIVPGKLFMKKKPGNEIFFHHQDLPFEFKISYVMRNCTPTENRPNFKVNVPIVDDYFLQEVPPRKEAEQNIPGIYISVVETISGKQYPGIIWGAERFPFITEIDGKYWSITLRPKSWKLPFTVVLDKFTRELHPRTGIAKAFMSDITKIEGGISQSFKISMNEPLRHQGYTLFQASWGPQNAKQGDPLFSSFAVVKNPADKFPEYACIIIGVGLFIHFSQLLFRYIKRQNKKAIQTDG